MALGSALRVPISHRIAQTRRSTSNQLPALLWAVFLTVVVAVPWLLACYWFGTDWPGLRHISFPTELDSIAPVQAALALISSAIGGEATGKLLVFGILFGAAFLSFTAAQSLGSAGGAVASTIYVINPFVYGRLHYGQLFLLAGYAVLPWSITRLRRLLLDPHISSAFEAAVGMVLLGALSLHLFVIVGLLALVLVLTHLISARQKATFIDRVGPPLVISAIVILSVIAYWIVPLLLGHGPEGVKLAAISTGARIAFAAVPDDHLGLVP